MRLLFSGKREIGEANHFDVISVINPEDAVVMLPAAVGAAVLDHKHLGAGLQITMHIVNQDKLPKIMCHCRGVPSFAMVCFVFSQKFLLPTEVEPLNIIPNNALRYNALKMTKNFGVLIDSVITRRTVRGDE